MAAKVWHRVVWTVGMWLAAHSGLAHEAPCAGPTPTFAYGNAGFGGGYSQWVHRQSPAPTWCSVPRPACGPSWGPCGWYGARRIVCRESVFLTVSPGGSATFFSGAVVPWPVVMPWWAGVNASAQSAAPLMAAPLDRPTLAMTDREPAIRMSNADARARARKLVAVGDRYLRESVNERAKISRALSSYRRAATIANDLPEVYVRQAIALVALDRKDEASRAVASVAAIDPRLQERVADEGLIAIRTIWSIPGDADACAEPAAHWIAERWNQRWHPEMTRVADAVTAAGR